MLTKLITLLIVTTTISTSQATTVQQFHPTAAVYVEDLSDIMFSRGTLKIVKKLSDSDAESDLWLANKVIEQFQTYSTKTNTQTEEIAQLTNYLKNHLKEVQTTIKTTLNRHPRNRRDNLLYDGLHYLFGLDNDAYEDISDLENNQEKISETITRHENVMLKITTNMEENTKRIQQKFNQNFKMATDQINRLSKREDVIVMYIQAKEVLEEVIRKYAEVTKQAQVQDLPDLRKYNLSISNHCSTTKRWRGNTLEVHYDHTIFETKTFTGYKLNFIPRKGDEEWEIIDHEVNYIAVRNHTYTLLTNEEWAKCTQEEEDLHICHSTILYDENEKQTCLLQYVKKLPPQDHCATRKIKINQLTLHPTEKPNTWVFSTPNAVQAMVTCENRTTNYTLTQTGLINLNPRCTLKTEHATIKAQQTDTKKIAKATVAYATLNATKIPEMEQLILQDQHKYSPHDTRRDMAHHARKNRHQAAGLSAGSIVVVVIIGWLFYSYCVKPKLAILTP